MEAVELSILTQAEIQRFIRVESVDGVTSSRLGATPKTRCTTCNGSVYSCDGHFGYYELYEPIIHPNFFKVISKILSSTCTRCFSVMKSKSCCGVAIPCVSVKNHIHLVPKYSTSQQTNALYCDFENGVPIIPSRIREILIGIEEKGCLPDGRFVKDIPRHRRYQETGIPFSIVDSIHAFVPILPLTLRPPNRRMNSNLTKLYISLVKANERFIRESDGPSFVKSNARDVVQRRFMAILDGSYGRETTNGFPSEKVSIRERISGKHGRIRRNLMGKRTDFSARSVATGDPNIAIDEIGIPFSIADTITFPERVTRYNKKRVNDLIRNGKVRYIIRRDGQHLDVAFLFNPKVSIGDTVERCLENGDYVVVNRQPTLHKGSMIGLKVRLLPGSTIRMNLSNTTPLNLDFDGDEVNVHIPQSYSAVVETRDLLSHSGSMIDTKNGASMFGLVQDTLLGLYLLSDPSITFDRCDAMDIISSLDEIPECFSCETGLDIISHVLPNTLYYQHDGVVIEDGRLVSGRLTKSHLGRSYDGLIATCVRKFGSEFTIKMMYDLQRIAMKFLQVHGFSVGLGDCFVKDVGKDGILKEMDQECKKELGMIMKKSPFSENAIEESMMKNSTIYRDKIAKKIKDTSKNGFVDMMNAGSKGSALNIVQIAGCLGQQSVYGGRVPFEFTERTLPHFKRHDYSSQSRGFVRSNFLKGLEAREFFFHAVSGRIGLLATAVETSIAGYISRKIVKSIENISSVYDGTVRDVLGHVVQFKYGDDSISTGKSKRLNVGNFVRNVRQRVNLQ